jgi:DNA-binding CsgD family transcriptional regulator
MSVLEDVIDAQSPTELSDRLPGALARHLGWVDAFDPATLTITPLDASVDLRGEQTRQTEQITRTLHDLLARLFRSLSYEQPIDDSSMTPRERDIARLVAEGLTNRQIATRLGITPGTVKKHLTSTLTKADCTNRTQLAIVWRQAHPAGPGSRSS